jgi:cytochrome c
MVLASAAGLAFSGAAAAGDASKGKALFDAQCSLCHSASAGVEGQAPSLNGVVGRKAASDPGFPAYTRQLKASGLTWTPANLEKFLSGPATLVPGTAMPIALASPQDRQNVIAYLASLKAGR